jgi:hypothetical protein
VTNLPSHSSSASSPPHTQVDALGNALKKELDELTKRLGAIPDYAAEVGDEECVSWARQVQATPPSPLPSPSPTPTPVPPPVSRSPRSPQEVQGKNRGGHPTKASRNGNAETRH